MHAPILLQGLNNKKQDTCMGLASKTEYLVLFHRLGHNDLILLGMTWSD